jgi:lipopolysaccharide export system protein LptC
VNWRAALTAVLLVAAVASGWSAWRRAAERPDGASGPARPDYVLETFELVSLDGDGREAFTLRAPRLHRQPGDGSYALETPRFLIPDDDGEHWTVDSAEGWVSPDNDLLRLTGGVRAEAAADGGRPLRMDTESMDVFPDTRTATSDARVTVVQPGTTMRGTGLQANLDSKRIRLLSNVETRHVPTRSR